MSSIFAKYQGGQNSGGGGGGGSGANTALSNLSGVAVNASLVPGMAGTIDLGSLSLPWNNAYAHTLLTTGNVAADGQLYSPLGTTSTPAGTTQTIDWNNGSTQELDLASASGNVTVTFTNTNSGSQMTLFVVQGASARNVTFTGVQWPGGTAPTISIRSGAVDVITFVVRGTTVYGTFDQNFLPLPPNSIPGLVLWLDGTDPSTMGNPSSGSTFSFWNDKSGNANNYSQSNSSFYPTYISNGAPSGKGIVRFPGPTTGFTNGSSALVSGAYTIFVYTKLNQTIAYNRLLAYDIPGDSGNSNVFLTTASGSFGMVQVTGVSPVASVSLDTTTFHSFCITYNGSGVSTLANYSLYYDDVLQSNSTTSNGHGNGNAVGYDGNVNSGNNEDVVFIAVYNRVLTSAELAQLQAYAPIAGS